jgi:glycosyltransferase involved in cell wall biosynthesis
VEGVTVPPERPDLLGDALASLAGDAGQRATLGEAALRRSAMFDIRRASARIEAVYDEVRR